MKPAVGSKLRWVLPIVLIIAGVIFVGIGVSLLMNMPPGRVHWTLTAVFSTPVSYPELMACLKSVPEVGQRPVSITIQEIGENKRRIILSPAPDNPAAVMAALQKRFGMTITTQSVSIGALYSTRTPWGWLLFALIFAVWPALLFLAAGQLIGFYRDRGAGVA